MAGKRSARHVEEQTGELNLVPYMDIVVNLILFLILTTTGLTSFGVINVSAPQIGSGDPSTEQPTEQPLNLTVGISGRGFFVSGSGGNLPTTGSSDQPTIPKINDNYDYAALTKKMVEIKSVFPRETKLIVTADPGTVYDVIVQVMDATRADGPNPLFPDVLLSPGVV